MTFKSFDPAAPARLILDSWRSGQHMDSLPADVRPESLDQGYEAQEQLFSIAGGERAGWKLGVGSPAGMRLANLDRPLVGQLERARLHASGVRLQMPSDAPVTIECEVAFILDRDVSPQRGKAPEAADFRATTITFEVVRSRFTDRKTVGWPSFTADNVGFEALVVGEPICAGIDEDLVRSLPHSVVVYLDGEPKAKGLFGDPATDPFNSLSALYEHAAERGYTLREGDIISTGAMCEPFDLAASGEHHVSVTYLGKSLEFFV
ncbi:2-keto-4-pentenoate hydratase [Pseudomonas sp. SbOxS1]|uniref:2-keto-4-pentenoate hydratase n=1 Tax=Pseudomonas sp. SbOxS1 TaxID=2723884 RepID=UPI001C5538FC|nr:hydratase [Pseudomonas sp. SbOxS1]